MSIIIDKEFEALIPPLTKDEFRQLEQNIEKDGIRDALIVWSQDDGNDILIDGHNRFKIAAKHGGIPFQIKRMDFGTRDAVRMWIIRNQMGRRNIDKWVKFDMSKQLEEIEKKYARKRMSDGAKGVPTLAQAGTGKTRDKMASMIGVSHGTYDKMKAIDEKATPEQKQLVREGTMSINQAYNAVTNKTPKRAKEEFLDELKERHEDFHNRKKTERAVSITEAMQDKEDQKTLAIDIWNKMIRMGNQIDDVHFGIKCGNYDTKNMMANIDEDKAEQLKKALSRWEKKLREMHMEVSSK